MTNEAMFQKPTISERFWRALGFHYHLGDEPEGIDKLEGWMRTDIRLEFSILDRLRLMLTGKLFIASVVHTDTPSASICKSRVDWRISAPGERSNG